METVLHTSLCPTYSLWAGYFSILPPRLRCKQLPAFLTGLSLPHPIVENRMCLEHGRNDCVCIIFFPLLPSFRYLEDTECEGAGSLRSSWSSVSCKENCQNPVSKAKCYIPSLPGKQMCGLWVAPAPSWSAWVFLALFSSHFVAMKNSSTEMAIFNRVVYIPLLSSVWPWLIIFMCVFLWT